LHQPVNGKLLMEGEDLFRLALELIELLSDMLCLCDPRNLAAQTGDLRIESLLEQPILNAPIIDLRHRRGGRWTIGR
jgi:hypothetical protein